MVTSFSTTDNKIHSSLACTQQLKPAPVHLYCVLSCPCWHNTTTPVLWLLYISVNIPACPKCFWMSWVMFASFAAEGSFWIHLSSSTWRLCEAPDEVRWARLTGPSSAGASCPWCAGGGSSLSAAPCGREAWARWPHLGCPRIPCPCKGSVEADSPGSQTLAPTRLFLETWQEKQQTALGLVCFRVQEVRKDY